VPSHRVTTRAEVNTGYFQAVSASAIGTIVRAQVSYEDQLPFFADVIILENVAGPQFNPTTILIIVSAVLAGLSTIRAMYIYCVCVESIPELRGSTYAATLLS